MSPLPESNVQNVYTSHKESQEKFFFNESLASHEIKYLLNPNQLQNEDFLHNLGIGLLLPFELADIDDQVVETYYVCHHFGKPDQLVVGGGVVYKTNLEGIYVSLQYEPESSLDSHTHDITFTRNPYEFRRGFMVKLGSEAEKEYLKSIKDLSHYHKVPNGFGILK